MNPDDSWAWEEWCRRGDGFDYMHPRTEERDAGDEFDEYCARNRAEAAKLLGELGFDQEVTP